MGTIRRCYSWGLALVFLLLPVTAQTSDDASKLEIPLTISKLPEDLWSKRRLEAALGDDGSALTLKDLGTGPFNDASFWQISFNKDLPYGRKEFSFRLNVPSDHRPLWGENLIQPMLNGKEANAALDADGNPSFEKIIADDGKGFIPVGSGVVRLALPKAERNLGVFAFMTAGAENFDMTMSDFKVTVWPESDDRVWPQRPIVSELGFRPDDPKRLMIEWHEDEGSLSNQKADILIDGPSGTQTVSVTIPRIPSTASGSRVSSVELGPFSESGDYSVTVPSLGPQTSEGKISFRVGDLSEAIARHRDDAWGTFYWITNNENGPYPRAHAQDKAARTYGDESQTRDVSGGWFDAGDYGKYTVNGAYSAGLMLLTGLLAPDALDHSIRPIAGGFADWPDWLSVVDAQLDWLVKMQGPDGGANHKATTRNWPGLDVPPEGDRDIKWLMPVSSTATADYAAVLALAAKLFQDRPDAVSRNKARRFAEAAVAARGWLKRNPGLVMTETEYDGADYGGPYTDGDDSDERFFADAAWAAFTRDPKDIAAAENQLADRRAALNADANDTHWGEVDLLGFWALKTIEDDLSETARETVNAALRSAAHKWRIERERAPWAIPHPDDATLAWGSNSVLATIGWHWLLWSQVSGDTKYVEPAQDLLHWFFGRNPQRQTYVTGKSDRSAKNPHFRPSVSGAIPLPDGFLVGGPNSGGLSGDPAGGGLIGSPPMRMYVDDKESYATNEVAINWQSAWALYLSLLSDVE